MRLLIALFFLVSTGVYAQMDTERKKQLDSIVTNIDRKILTNLDSVHAYIHKMGREDAERVFMFYGLISIHHKYDFKRLKEKKEAKEYTPYYTAKKKKGVCRDFAALFKALCDRSEIPCVVADGKVKLPWWLVSYKVLSFSYNPYHAWNVVKYRGKWHLMDPTWSQVYKTEKYYSTDSKGRKKYKGKVKRPTRTYFDASPRAFYYDRNASHPAFYLSREVYTYKTSRRKYKQRKIIYDDYDFNGILDSLGANKYYKYSSTFINDSYSYSEMSLYGYNINYMFNYLELKRTELDPITKESLDRHTSELDLILKYIKKDSGRNYSEQLLEHTMEILEFSEKLKKGG
ncbi:MAG: hypothetical protein ACJAUD_001204 [Crocinitomicaceae bacterium]|jgi:hypothetical protein